MTSLRWRMSVERTRWLSTWPGPRAVIWPLCSWIGIPCRRIATKESGGMLDHQQRSSESQIPTSPDQRKLQPQFGDADRDGGVVESDGFGCIRNIEWDHHSRKHHVLATRHSCR